VRSSVAGIETEELDSRWTALKLDRRRSGTGIRGYDRSASASTNTSISERGEGEASERRKGNERERDDERGADYYDYVR
jgi:hypothetical protein